MNNSTPKIKESTLKSAFNTINFIKFKIEFYNKLIKYVESNFTNLSSFERLITCYINSYHIDNDTKIILKNIDIIILNFYHIETKDIKNIIHKTIALKLNSSDKNKFINDEKYKIIDNKKYQLLSLIYNINDINTLLSLNYILFN